MWSQGASSGQRPSATAPASLWTRYQSEVAANESEPEPRRERHARPRHAAQPTLPERLEQPLAGDRRRVRPDQPPGEQRQRDRREHLHADEQEGVVRRARRRERRDVQRPVDDGGQLPAGELGDQREQGEPGNRAHPASRPRIARSYSRAAGRRLPRGTPPIDRTSVLRPLLLCRLAAPIAVVATTAASSAGSTAATRLVWKACGSGLECAKLAVPLDYSRPSGRQLELALIRLPAGNPAQRIGSLVVNPGGPGVSGVDWVRDAKRQAHTDAPRALRRRRLRPARCRDELTGRSAGRTHSATAR